MSAPLVLDYMQLKWCCTIPNWTRRFPLDFNVNEGFYTYVYATKDDDKKGKNKNTKRNCPAWDDSLLR